MSRSTAIPAVLDEEMAQLLIDIGEMDRVKSGKVRCQICKTVLEVNAIQLVVPIKNRVDYVCSSHTCLLQFALHDKEGEAT